MRPTGRSARALVLKCPKSSPEHLCGPCQFCRSSCLIIRDAALSPAPVASAPSSCPLASAHLSTSSKRSSRAASALPDLTRASPFRRVLNDRNWRICVLADRSMVKHVLAGEVRSSVRSGAPVSGSPVSSVHICPDSSDVQEAGRLSRRRRSGSWSGDVNLTPAPCWSAAMKSTPADCRVVTRSRALAVVTSAGPFVFSAFLIVLTASPVRSDRSETERVQQPRAARSWAPVTVTVVPSCSPSEFSSDT